MLIASQGRVDLSSKCLLPCNIVLKQPKTLQIRNQVMIQFPEQRSTTDKILVDSTDMQGDVPYDDEGKRTPVSFCKVPS